MAERYLTLRTEASGWVRDQRAPIDLRFATQAAAECSLFKSPERSPPLFQMDIPLECKQ
jgi:hypothetical protein